MTTPAVAPAIATRRAAVRQLAHDEPTLSHRAIGTRLGISKDTVRRDLEALAAADEAVTRDTPAQTPAPDAQPCAADPEVVLPGAAPAAVALARAARAAVELADDMAQMAHGSLPYLLTALEHTADLLSATLPAGAHHQPTAIRVAQHQLRRSAARLTALAHAPYSPKREAQDG